MQTPPPLNLLSYEKLDRHTADSGVRHYMEPITGKPLPSVTTILSATADKEWLEEWRLMVGEARADHIRDEASLIGTYMHDNLEAFLEGRELDGGGHPYRKLARKLTDVIIREGLCDVEEVWGIEAPLYFPGLYAGTADLIGVYKGKGAIMDFKNARQMRERDQIADYFAQLSAYALAHNEIMGTNIERGVIFMAARDLSYKTFVVDCGEFKVEQDRFLDRVQAFYEAQPSNTVIEQRA
jgi:hypothetical protein